jgi:cell division septal protein FtsQ
MKYRKPHRVKRKKSILKNRFFWLILLILVFFGSVFYLLILSSLFQIKNISIFGVEKISSDEIKNFVQNKLEKKILFLRTKSIFLININEIEKEVFNNFPPAAEIKIERKFPNTLNIILRERAPLANFCQAEKCFLLDEEGIIFEESEPKENFIKITDGQKEKIAKLGERAIEKDYLEKILKIQKYIQEELKLEIKEFIVFHHRLNLKMAEGWEIYFDPREDINWQLTKLKLVLEEKIPSEKRKDLEYIELRFGDLATFRYR